MSFYLRPPKGSINYYKLEECVKQRIQFYDNIQDPNVELRNFDCLIEDGVLDRTGHFIFRVAAICNSQFSNIFMKHETKLLQIRLNYYDNVDLKYFLKKILQQAKDCVRLDEIEGTLKCFLLNLGNLCRQMLKKDVINHVINNIHDNSNECEKYTLKVPFEDCASLIVNREFSLLQGYVCIPCLKWKTLLKALFTRYLQLVLREMSVENILSNDRIKEALKLIENHYFSNGSQVTEKIFHIENIENDSKYFPLCMQSLYGTLKKNHRLSHNARFDFSLFLKTIGASLEESMKFWESMYSKQHSTCSSCTHSWQQNEKKYIYGIRHMYGLEGARKNYSVRSCDYYQEMCLSARQEGGCPFKHFDDTNLRSTLKNVLPSCEDQIEVMIYERKENPKKSCKLFYENIYRILKNDQASQDVNLYNPAQFFQILKSNFM